MLKVTILCPNCGLSSNVFSGSFGIFPNEIISCNNCNETFSVFSATIGVNQHSAYQIAIN